MKMNALPSTTTIPLKWRFPSRVAWFTLAIGCFIIFIVGTIHMIQTPPPSCTAPEASCPFNTSVTQEDIAIAAEMNIPFSLLFVGLFFSISARLSVAIVGMIIFWRRSTDWVALLFAGALMTVLLEGVEVSGSLKILNHLLFALGIALFFPLPFIFPNGRFIPTRLRWPTVLLTIVYSIGYALFVSEPQFALPSGILTLIWFIMSIYAILFRYFRVSNAIERQQTKWVVFGLLITMVAASYYTFFYTSFPPSQPSQGRVIAFLINMPLYLICYFLLGLSILVAMLRYRLWGIDALIRRTLQYGLLSAALVTIYFGSVILIQRVISGINGQTQPSSLTVVISTLLIAILFNPIRSRIQKFIDRRFYRSKYNTAQILAQFAAKAMDEVDIDCLANSMLVVVEETLQPERISLWLQREERTITKRLEPDSNELYPGLS
jgi:hypothetical protein